MVTLVSPPRRAKRIFDILVSAVALVALSPLLLALALLIRGLLGSPVLFTQTRPGLHGRPFTIYKFRTMLDARYEDGSPLPDEERLTRFGRFLRATSLDELPELVNVLKGEMSLVGPRPLIMAYLDRYTSEQARRMDVPPGITGLAQVRGRNALSWNERLRLDVLYVDEWSFGLDLWILLQTMRAVVQREGISAEGHATMPEFRGVADDDGDDAAA
jgi:lipopolysaccharide/colanic/teichoic acid biosynthesis glycosyltransferase